MQEFRESRTAATLMLLMGAAPLALAAAPALPDAPEEVREPPEEAADSFSWMARAHRDDEEYADIRWKEFERRMGYDRNGHIAAYRGYGNGERIWLQGRLLENARYGGPGQDDGWWANLKASYLRWESDEIPDAPLTLSYAGSTKSVTTDAEGYYYASFPAKQEGPGEDHVLARHEGDERVLTARHDILLLDPRAEFLVISDVDDTIIRTGLTSRLTAARLTFLGNARTRKPLLGVAALYRALARGAGSTGVNPIVYVSNSAWNMYDLLRDFMELNDLPKGPLLLRDIGLGADSEDHKVETIDRLLKRYDPLPAILVGDSGQHDAEIYAGIAREYPRRVRAIYIRDVDPGKRSAHDEKVDRIIEGNARPDLTFTRVADSTEIARDLIRAGLLPAAALEEVRRSVRADRRRPRPGGPARR